jgi:23S rRNA (guanosine2251-2'-O)-methyltransferase
MKILTFRIYICSFHHHILPLKLLLQINILLMRKLTMEELNRKSVAEFKRSEKNQVIAVLENIRSAYNVGSVFRTADAFLIQSIYITGYTAKPPHKEIAKTALGAQDSVHWVYFETTKDAVENLKKNGFKIYVVEQVTDSISLEKFSAFNIEKIAFIFGNEVIGVDEKIIQYCDGCIEIPQFGMKHSLNISVAAGIVLWEAVKQMG